MQTVWVFLSQEVEEQSHSNQEILRLTYIHPKTYHDENVIQNLRHEKGGGEVGGGGVEVEGEDDGGGGIKFYEDVISKDFFLADHE